jgi:hypothetical protein
VQNFAINDEAIPELLATMDVCSAGFLDEDKSLLEDNELMDKMVLVKPIPIPVDDFFTEENMALTGNNPEDLEGELLCATMS